MGNHNIINYMATVVHCSDWLLSGQGFLLWPGNTSYRSPRYTKSAFNLIVGIHVMVNWLSKEIYICWPMSCGCSHGLKCTTHWVGMTFFLFLKVIRWPVIGLNCRPRSKIFLSLSKKLCLLLSIGSSPSFLFSEHDLLHTNVQNYFQCSFIVFIVFILRIALKRPYDKHLINLLCPLITGKSQTSALMY